jgi:hypothetical protein
MTRIQLLKRDDDNSSDEENALKNDVRFSIDVSVSEDRLENERKAAKRKTDQSLMLIRVVMKYLETKDPDMHTRAKSVIWESVEKRKRKEQGFESIAGLVKELRNTIGVQYWDRAQSYLKHFQEKKLHVQGSSV